MSMGSTAAAIAASTEVTAMTEHVGFDFEAEGALWAVCAGVPIERALLEALVCCLGVADRLDLAGRGAGAIHGDLARALTLPLLAAQAVIDAVLPACVRGREASLRLLEASEQLGVTIDLFVAAETPDVDPVEGRAAAAAAKRVRRAATALNGARESLEVDRPKPARIAAVAVP